MYKRIIIGYNGSDSAHDALAMGRKMADFENAAIRLSPAHDLLRSADAWHADLIVVGSSDRAGHGHIAIGRAGEQTPHGSACPVLVAPWGYRDVEAKLGRVAVADNGSEESHPALHEAVRERSTRLVLHTTA
jgi:nucleotide-binding universal stress UspA family protein